MMPHILFHRHTAWQSEIRCSTNIFAKLFMDDGFDVSYMHGMVHAGNILARTGRWESWAKGPRWDKGAWVFTPMSLVPFSRMKPFNSEWAAHLSYKTCVPGIRNYVDRAGKGDPDIIWTANPGSIALKSIFPNSRLVFQVVDYYPAFSGDSIKKIERSDYEGADHILVIGETLKKYIIDEHGIDAGKITVLGQGVFTQGYQQPAEPPEELKNLPRPLAIWVGVIDKCDPPMFEKAADELRKRGGSLVMIGPGADWADRLRERFDNVYLLGSRTPEEVPGYLSHADLGLMLYDQEKQEIYRGQNPLKLYEYAAAGLPILSTPHDEYRYMDAPVIIISDIDEVGPGISKALENKHAMSEAALKFVASRSWESVYSKAKTEILKLIRP